MDNMVTKPHISSHMQQVSDDIWGRIEQKFDSINIQLKEFDKVKMDRIYCLELLDRKASSESMDKFVNNIHNMKMKVEEKVMANLHEALAKLNKDMHSKLDINDFNDKI